jgi:Kef-type K+ transport system membrane component KefB
MPAFPIDDPILQFTALVTISLVMQLLFERFHLPGIVGLLLAGMLLGPGALHVLPRGDVMDLLGAVGLVYLMFMAGVEIDLGVFRTHYRETAVFGSLAFSLSLVPAVIGGFLIGFDWTAAILLGALLSSHTLLAYPIVASLRLTHRHSIVTTIGGTLLTDTLALLLLALVIAEPDGGMLGRVMPLLLLALMAGGSLWLVPLVGRHVLERFATQRATRALFALVVLLLLASLAEVIGTHEILGAFLAGVCLNRTMGRRPELLEHFDFVGRMLFIPFFFISTGMLLDLNVFRGDLTVWWLAAMLLAVVLVGKASASWLSGGLYGYSRLDRLMMMSLTIPQAAATLAVAIVARQAGLFPDAVVDAVIVLIFVTCLLGPVLTRLIGKRLQQREEATQPPD